MYLSVHFLFICLGVIEVSQSVPWRFINFIKFFAIKSSKSFLFLQITISFQDSNYIYKLSHYIISVLICRLYFYIFTFHALFWIISSDRSSKSIFFSYVYLQVNLLT